MILYHGTSRKHLESILENGILPTSKSNNVSNWDLESAKDKVYLSNTYALHYSFCAAQDDDDAVVIKVDIDEDLMFPDEDFLGQADRDFGDLIKATEFYRDSLEVIFSPEQINLLAKRSLMHLGNVAVSQVTKEQLVSYTIIPSEEIVRIVIEEGCNPSVTMLHHQILGYRYQDQLANIENEFETVRLKD